MAPGLCEHVTAGRWPFRLELVLDEQLGFTDAVAVCRACGRHYLLEMLDWRGSERVMRIAPVAAEQAAGVIRDLTRGSCDAGRAGAEVHHLRSQAPFYPWLLLVDMSGPVLAAVVPVPADTALPAAGWRDLPCDGRWVDYARS